MYKSYKDENKILQLQNSYAIFSVINNTHFYLWDELLLKTVKKQKCQVDETLTGNSDILSVEKKSYN